MKKVGVINFKNYSESVKEALDSIEANKIISQQNQILIKPNLIDSIPFPVTTHPDCVSIIIDYVRNCSDTKIIIAEGCGSSTLETDEVFRELGYDKLAKDKKVSLIDLNKEPVTKLRKAGLKIFPEYYIPEIAMKSYILSVPVLKAHSLARVTLALKNMMGFAPPKYYQKGGHWKKSFFHANMHEAIIEMNAYRKADMVLLDATVGMAEYHLGGKHCSSPLNKLVDGYDSAEVDKISAELLGFDWTHIKHISDANKYKSK